MSSIINWDDFREQTKARAKEFVEANDLDRVWYVAGEIVDASVICGAWDENIHEVCKYQLVHGKMFQPKMAEFLIDKNT
jgi:hypothetical protein